MATADLTGKALKTLVSEGLRGATTTSGWFLNPGDPGMISVLGSISAAEASHAPAPGRRTIAAHASHILYHLELIARVLAGEHDAFAKADWNNAWENQTVDDAAWQSLQDQLAKQADHWINHCDQVSVTDETMLTGSMGSAAHFAYHLGAIRQIMLDVKGSTNNAP